MGRDCRQTYAPGGCRRADKSQVGLGDSNRSQLRLYRMYNDDKTQTTVGYRTAGVMWKIERHNLPEKLNKSIHVWARRLRSLLRSL